MAVLEHRVDRLESMMAEVAHAQMRTEMSLLALSNEMREFKDEMGEFKDEMREFKEESERDRKRMNKAWGDLANKMGTVAEDIVAPNIRHLAREEFGMGLQVDLLVRAYRRSRRGETRLREYDVVCAGEAKVIVADVKSSPAAEHISAFVDKLKEFGDFYPEYDGLERIGVFASWSLPGPLPGAIGAAGLFGLAMGDETMEIVARPAGTQVAP